MFIHMRLVYLLAEVTTILRSLRKDRVYFQTEKQTRSRAMLLRIWSFHAVALQREDTICMKMYTARIGPLLAITEVRARELWHITTREQT